MLHSGSDGKPRVTLKRAAWKCEDALRLHETRIQGLRDHLVLIFFVLIISEVFCIWNHLFQGPV